MMTNPHEREMLESILHPRILDYIQKQMRKWKENNTKIAFVEGARLIESGFHKLLAGLVLVTSDEKNRIKRVMKRDSMGKDEVTMMMELQNEHLMKSTCKVQWVNDTKTSDLHKKIDEFIKIRLAKQS